MSELTTGVFENYLQAGAVVRELESLGISGDQVEVVTDAGHDARAEGFIEPEQSDWSKGPNPEVTMVIVRPADDHAIEQAKDVMQRHGAKVWQMAVGSPEPPTKPVPPTVPLPSESSKGAGIGGPGTTGHDEADLEGRGKDFDVHNPGAPGEGETGPPPDVDHPPT